LIRQFVEWHRSSVATPPGSCASSSLDLEWRLNLASISNKVTKSFQWGQHTVTMKPANRQASGAVLADMDGTVVLATVAQNRRTRRPQDFFP
jgi:hypothetical protein